eukprot:CAMPEP_0119046646 /NCGR_PEP_ID=MMETSP1177-20130426/47964_1 /TAXON_ID=2985 /ORGANISM="Ochromonas sp, Strain CCMP1899" /LENGTH=272 /DNA_ID=CAMNT_0007020089 /DNA_START=121 /DNA_END=936 /DNA_ORIENTATION=-
MKNLIAVSTESRTSNRTGYNQILQEDDQRPLLIEDKERGGGHTRDEKDPFYVVKNHVNTQVEMIRSKLEIYLDMVEKSETNNEEFENLKGGLVRDVRDATYDFKGLEGAVKMVTKNRLKFGHISDAELGLRQKYVHDTEIALNEFRTGIEPRTAKINHENNNMKSKKQAINNSSSNMYDLKEDAHEGNNDFMMDQKARNIQSILDQDSQLDSLGTAVDRLGALGLDIHDEIKDQNKMLDVLESDMDDAGLNMNTLMSSLSKLLKTNNGCQIW